MSEKIEKAKIGYGWLALTADGEHMQTYGTWNPRPTTPETLARVQDSLTNNPKRPYDPAEVIYMVIQPEQLANADKLSKELNTTTNEYEWFEFVEHLKSLPRKMCGGRHRCIALNEIAKRQFKAWQLCKRAIREVTQKPEKAPGDHAKKLEELAQREIFHRNEYQEEVKWLVCALDAGELRSNRCHPQGTNQLVLFQVKSTRLWASTSREIGWSRGPMHQTQSALCTSFDLLALGRKHTGK